MTIVKSDQANLSQEHISKLNATEKGFFFSANWFRNFIETVAKPMDVKVDFFYQEDVDYPVILPVMYTTRNALKVVKSLTNYYSPIYSVLGDAAVKDKKPVVDFFSELKKQLPEWDIMELSPLAFEENQYLLAQLKLAGLPGVGFFCFGNWYMHVGGRSFNEYFAGLSSQLKNTVNRKAKKFFQLEGARVEIITSEDGLLRGIDAYNHVYQSSWKVQEPFPEFMPGLMQSAASVGGLRLGIAYLGEQAIAAQLWIVADQSAYIFKLAYDENYKQYSAGSILTTKLMEQVIDIDKVEVIDYLCGDDAYKKDWMTDRRERWGILAFNTSTVRGFTEYVKEICKSYVKQIKAIFSNPAQEKI